MWKRALIYGAAIAIAGAVLTAVMAAAGLHTNPDSGQWVGLLGVVFPIVGIVLAIRAAKRAESGEFTFGDGFKEGAAVSLVAAVLGGLLSYLYLTAINPGYLEAVREATAAQLQARGFSAREVAQAQAMSSSMMTPGGTSGLGAAGQFAMGLIISAVAALFMRRKADPAQYS